MRCRVVDGCLVVGRYVLRRGAPATVAAALASGARAVRLRQLWLWNLKKLAKAVGGTLYPALSRLVHERAARPLARANHLVVRSEAPTATTQQHPGSRS